MVPELRAEYNARFDPAAYERLVADINAAYRNSLEFRMCETPLFLSESFTKKLYQAATDVLRVLQEPGFAEKAEAALPPGSKVASEDEHPLFLQIDYAICRDERGEFTPQLIELQGFPSLYCYQHFLNGKLREYLPIPEQLTPFFSGLSAEDYRELLGRVLLGDSDPENVVLLEIEPEKQKTRIDFYLCEEYYGIRPVCVTRVIHRGRKLYYRHGGREIPIERMYHRFIFDELHRKNLQISFDIDEDLDVTWVGHPNWFFKISKHTLPLIQSEFCPPCYYLSALDRYPDDLENYVLKPLFSFAGSGVEIDISARRLDELPDHENYILQRKVEYTPFLETPDEKAKAEIRLMFIWDDQPRLVNNLIRVSKGKMMGVDFNRNKSWIGSSLAFHPDI